jgi:short-subunit dehydrogenase
LAFDFAGARILITGASSGIGAAFAREAAARGARLVLVARRKTLLDEVAASCGGALTHTADIGDLDAAAAAGRFAVETLGGLDVLVNCAGIPRRVHTRRLTIADVEETTRVNYLGAVAVTLAVLPAMLDAGSGHVLNVGSVAGRLPAPRESAYVASKFALTGMTECMREDLAGTGVQVHIVHPGVIDTPLWDVPGQETPAATGEAVPVEDVVAAMIRLLETGRFEAYVPAWFRAVNVLRAIGGAAFLSAAARFDRRQVPSAYR